MSNYLICTVIYSTLAFCACVAARSPALAQGVPHTGVSTVHKLFLTNKVCEHQLLILVAQEKVVLAEAMVKESNFYRGCNFETSELNSIYDDSHLSVKNNHSKMGSSNE